MSQRIVHVSISFLLFVRHFDAVLFADIPEDVRGGLVVSIYVLGLFYFRVTTCHVIGGFFVAMSKSSYWVALLL